MRLGQIIRYWGDGVGTRNAQNKAIKVNIYESEGMKVVYTISKDHSKENLKECLKFQILLKIPREQITLNFFNWHPNNHFILQVCPSFGTAAGVYLRRGHFLV